MAAVFKKINDRHQNTNPQCSENTKENTYQNMYTWVYHIHGAEILRQGGNLQREKKNK